MASEAMGVGYDVTNTLRKYQFFHNIPLSMTSSFEKNTKYKNKIRRWLHVFL